MMCDRSLVMEDISPKDESSGMLMGDDSSAASSAALQHLQQSQSLQHQLTHQQLQQLQQHGGGGSLLQHGGSPLQHGPLRLGSAEAQYLEGLLREKESLGTSQGMDLARRLVAQGKM